MLLLQMLLCHEDLPHCSSRIYPEEMLDPACLFFVKFVFPARSLHLPGLVPPFSCSCRGLIVLLSIVLARLATLSLSPPVFFIGFIV